MNGLGIAGTLNRLPTLLYRCKDLLSPNGRILADSSDLRYVFEDENGLFDWDTNDGYYGEVDFKMIYVDFETLKTIANQCGLSVKKIADGEHYDYLAEIKQSI